MIRKRRSVIPILFCSFLPPSSSPPHLSSTLATPSLLHPPSTARNGFGMPPVLYGSTELLLRMCTGRGSGGGYGGYGSKGYGYGAGFLKPANTVDPYRGLRAFYLISLLGDFGLMNSSVFKLRKFELDEQEWKILGDLSMMYKAATHASRRILGLPPATVGTAPRHLSNGCLARSIGDLEASRTARLKHGCDPSFAVVKRPSRPFDREVVQGANIPNCQGNRDYKSVLNPYTCDGPSRPVGDLENSSTVEPRAVTVLNPRGWGIEGYGSGSARGRPAGDPCTSLAITDQLTPAPSVWLIIGVVQKNLPLTSICAELPLSRWSFSEGGEQHRGKGTHKCGSLPVLRGGTRRTWIWACLKYL
ncbi:hypothetical protein B0H14DRAFT_3775946 [Mycena olivaceomarginata]|nr:hypothetical protein B0H14DRAFT_3775946 [Mycena olivaceomarginata]